ncbi:16S rRNA (guanine(527)-N(7))-methyltransferase RsmG [[Mycoplasma] falconis]|uniref:Ribosomal RNA small subunit methyltransferase G n=1 Tax=[Mycoplasma] falconis TaxID=92403 RepID=A0A501XBY8_9BACT|nr:16S rRNA (guanine(527)-N(7))-methyltransferase RsmG [[Mycoplasma] falconis]TPE58070.1 16S rRNA (guanine(527)-N(7))-methyltransferase RsmG [[Mycoplasma] falconis]
MITEKAAFNLFDKYLPLTSEIVKQNLYQYYVLIEEENSKYNLTGFYDEKLICEGLIESILIFKKIEKNIFDFKNKNVLDIGSGAGFPILPYFIYNPDFDLTIYEPMQKRVYFLNKVIEKLNLKNIAVKPVRAEDSKDSEIFDFISARAVSELKNLVEITHKLGKIDSTFCFLKSQNYSEEINNANWIKNKLSINFQVKDLNKFFSINNVLVYYKKEFKTPYDIPRKWAQIIKYNLNKK